MLAVLPVLLALVIAPAANAHCGLINASVVSAKAWYGLSDAPPTLLFNIADDEGSGRDYANEANGTYYVATSAGPFGWAVTPAWSTYSPGANPIRAALFCVAGTQVMRAIVNYDPSAPTVDWNSPTSDRWLRGSIPLQVVGRDDLSGVDHFALTLGAGTVVSSADGAATLDTTGLPDGPHALTATAVDRAGNRSDVATRSVRIDNGRAARLARRAGTGDPGLGLAGACGERRRQRERSRAGAVRAATCDRRRLAAAGCRRRCSVPRRIGGPGR